MSKRSFYCLYLGFTEVKSSSNGQQYINEAIQKLLSQTHLLGKNSNYHNNREAYLTPSKVTLKLSDNSLTLLGGAVVNYKANTKVASTPKSYSIPYERINNVSRLTGQFEDIVTLITTKAINVPEYNNNELIPSSRTQYISHLHAFRCDSNETGKRLERLLSEITVQQKKQQQQQQQQVFRTNNNETEITNNSNIYTSQQKQINNNNNSNNNQLYMQPTVQKNRNLANVYKLSARAIIPTEEPPMSQYNQNYNSSGGTESSSSANSSEKSDTINIPLSNVTKELKEKFNSKEPLLLPPKDYNTVLRQQGDLNKANNRRSLNKYVVGKTALEMRHNKIDEEENNIRNKSFNSIDEYSIDEDAANAIKLLDDVVDSQITTTTTTYTQSTNGYTNSSTTTADHFFHFEPPKSNSPQFNSNNDAIKKNPLHVIDEEDTFVNVKPSNILKKNRFDLRSSNDNLSPRSNTSQFLDSSGGFHGGFKKFGGYKPKWLPDQAAVNFESSLQTEQYYKMKYNNNVVNTNNNNNNNNSQFQQLNKNGSKSNSFLKQPQVNNNNNNNNNVYPSESNVLSKNLTHSTPNLTTSEPDYTSTNNEMSSGEILNNMNNGYNNQQRRVSNLQRLSNFARLRQINAAINGESTDNNDTAQNKNILNIPTTSPRYHDVYSNNNSDVFFKTSLQIDNQNNSTGTNSNQSSSNSNVYNNLYIDVYY